MDQLDRILLSEEGLAPSSGFTDSVMEVVTREAQTPPPLPFPWRRLVIGLLAALVPTVAGVVVILTTGVSLDLEDLVVPPGSGARYVLWMSAGLFASMASIFLSLKWMET